MKNKYSYIDMLCFRASCDSDHKEKMLELMQSEIIDKLTTMGYTAFVAGNEENPTSCSFAIMDVDTTSKFDEVIELVNTKLEEIVSLTNV